MALREKMSLNWRLRELKRECLYSSMLQWLNDVQGLKNSFDSSEIIVEECFTELQSRERNLVNVLNLTLKRNEELDTLRLCVEQRFHALENEERKFRLSSESYNNELNAKEMKLKLYMESIEDLLHKFKFEHDQIESDKVWVRKKLEEIKSEEIYIETRAKQVEDQENMLIFKEKHAKPADKNESEIAWIGKKLEEIKLKELSIENRAKEVEERERVMNLKEKKSDQDTNIESYGVGGEKGFNKGRSKNIYFENFKERETKLHPQEKNFELFESSSEQRWRELEDKEKKFESALENPIWKQMLLCDESQTEEDSDTIKNSPHKRTNPRFPIRKSKRIAAGCGDSDGMKKCKMVLAKVMEDNDAWVFNKPVEATALEFPDYHQIIKQPMDLGTVKSKLYSKNEYKTPLDFANDVRLTFDNALAYNPKNSKVHEMADRLRKRFEKDFYDKFF